MKRAMQKRTLKTRARLISVSEDLVRDAGYEALRVDDVVRLAGVAKGTFFAHFRDKDALMEILIGDALSRRLEQAGTLPSPTDIPALIAALEPIHSFMTSERYVFDVILRYSGAAAIAETGPIAQCFGRYVELVSDWLTEAQFRQDISAELQAEGVQAFAVQAMALKFCALHSAQGIKDRLGMYLDAWLAPAT